MGNADGGQALLFESVPAVMEHACLQLPSPSTPPSLFALSPPAPPNGQRLRAVGRAAPGLRGPAPDCDTLRTGPPCSETGRPPGRGKLCRVHWGFGDIVEPSVKPHGVPVSATVPVAAGGWPATPPRPTPCWCQGVWGRQDSVTPGLSLPAYQALFHVASRARGIPACWLVSAAVLEGGGWRGADAWACSVGMSPLLSSVVAFLRNYVSGNLRTALWEKRGSGFGVCQVRCGRCF